MIRTRHVPLQDHEADASPGTVTRLLHGWSRGEEEAAEHLFTVVYPELHRIVARRLPRRSSFNDQVSDLVHETYLRLSGQKQVHWRNRSHFFAIAARLIRRIVLDRVKHQRRLKRGDGVAHVSVDDVEIILTEPHVDTIALWQALDQLAVSYPKAARIVKLRYMAGLSVEEAAQAVGMGRASVVRSWQFARAWLERRLGVPSGP